MAFPNHILIAGPTASGKSSLALKLAEERNGVIVNTDAFQVYDCYRILTARPSLEDTERAPHALYGYIPNIPGFSVGQWLRDVKALLAETGETLIFTGGTGLYFSALLNGLSEIPEVEEKIRHNVQNEYESDGLTSLVARLKEVDPEICVRLDLNNPRRVMRALEVFDGTGKPLSNWQSETPPPLLSNENCEKIVVQPDVETSNIRIETRFDQMIKESVLEEIRSQMNPWISELPANQAIGAQPLAEHLNGDISLERARELSITQTRQYAKRQRTWFRSRMKSWRFIESAQYY